MSKKKMKMTVKIAHSLFGVCGLLMNSDFQAILEGSGYVLNEAAVESMRAKAALVIAKDAIKKGGFKFKKVLIGAPAPEAPIETLEV